MCRHSPGSPPGPASIGAGAPGGGAAGEAPSEAGGGAGVSEVALKSVSMAIFAGTLCTLESCWVFISPFALFASSQRPSYLLLFSTVALLSFKLSRSYKPTTGWASALRARERCRTKAAS